jgi:hypothetical protein
MERLPVGYLLVNKFPAKGDCLEARDRISEYLNFLKDEGITADLIHRDFGRRQNMNREYEWYVVVAGNRPEKYIDEQLKQFLSTGVPASVPLEMLSIILDRQILEQDGWFGGWRRRTISELLSGPTSDHN